jgi:hypothetical protein
MARKWHGTASRLRDRRGTATDQPQRAERVTGIEPAFSAWEADVLPLNYTREER